MSELPPFITPTYPFQQAWYYIPKYQQEPLRTDLLDLLPFPWYKGLGLGLHIMPTQSTAALPTYPTDLSIRRNALYYRVAPALTAITTKAYLPALATKFRIGPRSWITRTSWTYGKYRTETPLPATPDKNLLRPP